MRAFVCVVRARACAWCVLARAFVRACIRCVHARCTCVRHGAHESLEDDSARVVLADDFP